MVVKWHHFGCSAPVAADCTLACSCQAASQLDVPSTGATSNTNALSSLYPMAYKLYCARTSYLFCLCHFAMRWTRLVAYKQHRSATQPIYSTSCRDGRDKSIEKSELMYESTSGIENVSACGRSVSIACQIGKLAGVVLSSVARQREWSIVNCDRRSTTSKTSQKNMSHLLFLHWLVSWSHILSCSQCAWGHVHEYMKIPHHWKMYINITDD